MDQPKIERVLLLMRLLSGSRRYTLNEIAEKLGLSERSVYRYLDTFRSANIDIEQSNGYVRMNTNCTEYKAFIKIVNTTYEGRVAQNLADIHNAISQKHQVCLSNYASTHSATVRDRLVEPFEAYVTSPYFWAFDVEDKRCKCFHAGRMDRVTVFSTLWQHAKQHCSQPIDVFNTHGGVSCAVCLRLSIRARNLLIEEYPAAEADLNATPDDLGFYHLRTTLQALEGAGRFVLGLPGEIEIEEGEALKEYVAGKKEG